jgi:hypothetical protein
VAPLASLPQPLVFGRLHFLAQLFEFCAVYSLPYLREQLTFLFLLGMMFDIII